MAQTGIDLGKAFVQIVPSAQGISGSITNLMSGEADTAGASLGSKLVGGMKKAMAGLAIGKFFKDSIMAGGELEQSIGGIETLFKDSAQTVFNNAQKAYKTANISANQYMQQATSFSASLLQSLGGDQAKVAEVTDRAILDMADNANKMGTPLESIQNAYQGFAKQNYQMLDNLKLGYGKMKCRIKSRLTVLLTGVHTLIKNKYVLIGEI